MLSPRWKAFFCSQTGSHFSLLKVSHLAVWKHFSPRTGSLHSLLKLSHVAVHQENIGRQADRRSTWVELFGKK
jgi:hypothetical protein